MQPCDVKGETGALMVISLLLQGVTMPVRGSPVVDRRETHRETRTGRPRSVQTSTSEVVIMRSIILDFVVRLKCSQGAKRRATAPPVATRLVNAVVFSTRRVVNGISRSLLGSVR